MAPSGRKPDGTATVGSGTTLSPVAEVALALALRSVPRPVGTVDRIEDVVCSA